MFLGNGPKSCSPCFVPSLLFSVVVSAFSKGCIALSNNAGFSFLFCFCIKPEFVPGLQKEKRKQRKPRPSAVSATRLWKSKCRTLAQDSLGRVFPRDLLISGSLLSWVPQKPFLHFRGLCSDHLCPTPWWALFGFCLSLRGHLENRFLQVLKWTSGFVAKILTGIQCLRGTLSLPGWTFPLTKQSMSWVIFPLLSQRRIAQITLPISYNLCLFKTHIFIFIIVPALSFCWSSFLPSSVSPASSTCSGERDYVAFFCLWFPRVSNLSCETCFAPSIIKRCELRFHLGLEDFLRLRTC